MFVFLCLSAGLLPYGPFFKGPHTSYLSEPNYISYINYYISSRSVCTNFPDFPCSLRNIMDIYFFWNKFFFVYHSSIIIAMTYTWHRTVRFSSCLLTLLTIVLVTFGTDYILSFQQIRFITLNVCVALMPVFSVLEVLMPHNHRDPLSRLCGHDVALSIRYEYLQKDTAIRARFYRWAKKTKKKWNIDEEKLFVSTVVGMFTSVSVTILCVYVLYR